MNTEANRNETLDPALTGLPHQSPPQGDASNSDPQPTSSPTPSKQPPAPNNPEDKTESGTESNTQEGQTPTTENVVVDDPEVKASVITVLIQTGASKSGAETLFSKMTDQEKLLLGGSIAIEEGQYRIKDTAAYFTAFQSISDRLYKATGAQIEDPSSPQSHNPDLPS